MDSYIEQFNKTFGELLNDLDTVYPNLKDETGKLRQKYSAEEDPRAYLNYFIGRMFLNGEVEKMITDKNPALLRDLQVFDTLDLAFMVEDSKHRPNLEIVWQYVAALYMIAHNIMKETQAKLENVENPNDITQIMSAMGIDEKALEMTGEMFSKLMKDMEGKDKEEVSPELKNLADNILGGQIGNVAKEIAQELEKEGVNFQTENPDDLLKSLLGGGGGDNGNLMNLVQGIGSKLESKINSGQIDQKALFSEATGIMSQLQNVPGMDKMFGGLAGGAGGMPFDPNMLAGLMGGLGGSSKKKNPDNLKLLPRNHPKRRGKQ